MLWPMLTDGGAIRLTRDSSETRGFLLRGAQAPDGEAVVVRVPGDEALQSERSVCGLKAFLVDERRAFRRADGRDDLVDCTRVAVLDISDSPVHVHGETVETYHILSGTGRMVLGDTVRAVGPGDLVLLPPGLPHGLCSDDPEQPVRVLMTFAPGLAPVAWQQWRDERILEPSAAAVIRARKSPG